MSRSVAIHPYAVSTVFLRFHGDFDDYGWPYFLDSIREVLTGEAGVEADVLINSHSFTGFQGYKPADRWVGREVHVVLEGELSEVSVSEYDGIVSVCLAPLDPDNQSQTVACSNAAKYFRELLRAAFPDNILNKLGTASNGESFYEVAYP
jgi:hypothetical protein